MTDSNTPQPALQRAKELLSRDLSKWKRPLHKRVRWWNLAYLALGIASVTAIVAPLAAPAYRQGFVGNLVSSAWQLIVGGVVAWILYNRFKVERFKRVTPFDWDEPFEKMHRISYELVRSGTEQPPTLKTVLAADTGKDLFAALVRAQRKVIIFGRFLEVEQLADIDRCCDAAERLANIDHTLPLQHFMYEALSSVFVLYAASSHVRDYKVSYAVLDQLEKVREEWSAFPKPAAET